VDHIPQEDVTVITAQLRMQPYPIKDLLTPQLVEYCKDIHLLE